MSDRSMLVAMDGNVIVIIVVIIIYTAKLYTM